jgi:hypothetical protein
MRRSRPVRQVSARLGSALAERFLVERVGKC